MSYDIVKAAPEVPVCSPAHEKTPEREAMELLAVGDAFMAATEDAMQRARWARAKLAPKKFTVRKVPRKGWQVRRVA